jgi:hypothetical protein
MTHKPQHDQWIAVDTENLTRITSVEDIRRQLQIINSIQQVQPHCNEGLTLSDSEIRVFDVQGCSLML